MSNLFGAIINMQFSNKLLIKCSLQNYCYFYSLLWSILSVLSSTSFFFSLCFSFYSLAVCSLCPACPSSLVYLMKWLVGKQLK